MQAISFISFVTKVRFSASHPFCFFYGVTMLLEAKKKKKKKVHGVGFTKENRSRSSFLLIQNVM